MSGSDNATLLLAWASMAGKLYIYSDTKEFGIRQPTIEYWWAVMNARGNNIKYLYIPTHLGKNKLIIEK